MPISKCRVLSLLPSRVRFSAPHIYRLTSLPFTISGTTTYSDIVPSLINHLCPMSLALENLRRLFLTRPMGLCLCLSLACKEKDGQAWIELKESVMSVL